MKKVFLDNLPKGGKFIKDNSVNWKDSIGFKVPFIYEDIEGEVEIVDVKTPYLYIKYLNNEPFKIKNVNFIYCKFGTMLKKITVDFKLNINEQLKDNKRNITITERKNIDNPNNDGKYLKVYKYKCNICGFDCKNHYSVKDKIFKDELWVEESNLINGQGCSCCRGNNVVVENINSIYRTDPWMIPYIGEECAKTHTYNSTYMVFPICPLCGTKKKSKMKICTINIEHSIGCNCNDGISIPNKTMFNVLCQIGINFETEYSPEWIKPRRYDFYIPSMNLIIEMDGGFHEKDNTMNGQTVVESKDIDDYKDEQAKLHGMEVVRVDCDYKNKDRFEYIKQNILNSNLNILFDLNKVDWVKVEEFTLSNLVKVACEYKRNNPNMTTTEIGQCMKLTPQTIWKFLRQGNKLKWCVYDSNIERRKGIKIICLDDNKIFNSINEASSFYNIDSSSIGKVCSGKLKTIKKIKFMYLKDYEIINNRESLL